MSEKQQTAVEWLFEKLDISQGYESAIELLEQAKEMEKEQSHKYAEFAIRCDRLEMKILNFEDWIKLQTFKSE